MPSYDIERALRDEGYAVICGVDEAGRGPLCGSVVAAACILPDGLDIPELNDSKKLTPKKRDKLFDLIKEKAIAYGIAEGTVEEINELNILEADLLAMRRAIDGLHTPDGHPYKADIAVDLIPVVLEVARAVAHRVTVFAKDKRTRFARV